MHFEGGTFKEKADSDRVPVPVNAFCVAEQILFFNPGNSHKSTVWYYWNLVGKRPFLTDSLTYPCCCRTRARGHLNVNWLVAEFSTIDNLSVIQPKFFNQKRQNIQPYHSKNEPKQALSNQRTLNVHQIRI